MSAVIGFGGFAFITATIAQIIRYRRYATLIERQQARWMVFALCLVLSSGLLAVVATALQGPESVVVGLLLTATAIASFLIPGAAVIAIRRHRLYDLDRVISRAVSFSIVIGLVGMLYIGGVIAVQALIPTAGDIAVAGSTLAAAAVLTPLRRRVLQRGVERRFNRDRFNAETELAVFSDRESNEVGLRLWQTNSLKWSRTRYSLLQPGYGSEASVQVGGSAFRADPAQRLEDVDSVGCKSEEVSEQ